MQRLLDGGDLFCPYRWPIKSCKAFQAKVAPIQATIKPSIPSVTTGGDAGSGRAYQAVATTLPLLPSQDCSKPPKKFFTFNSRLSR